MGTTLLLGAGILMILVLARINKSNKLFWTFLLSLLAGFVGGSLASLANTTKKPRIEIVKQLPTQTSMCSLQVTLCGTDEHYDIRAIKAKSESKDIVTSFNTKLAYETTANSVLQPTQPFDTS